MLPHYFEQGFFGGEMQFVPRPAAKDEDDGWIVGLVFNKQENRSELVIIAPWEPHAAPMERIKIPARVPFGFHGTWLQEPFTFKGALS